MSSAEDVEDSWSALLQLANGEERPEQPPLQHGGGTKATAPDLWGARTPAPVVVTIEDPSELTYLDCPYAPTAPGARSGASSKRVCALLAPTMSYLGIIHTAQVIVKRPWTADEDHTMRDLVTMYGPRKWSAIASHLPGRVGKQCRERWQNHLRPDVNKGPWTADEERILLEAHGEMGNRWAELAKLLPGRTDNAVKNHYNGLQSRKRKMKGETTQDRSRCKHKKATADSTTTETGHSPKTPSHSKKPGRGTGLMLGFSDAAATSLGTTPSGSESSRENESPVFDKPDSSRRQSPDEMGSGSSKAAALPVAFGADLDGHQTLISPTARVD